MPDSLSANIESQISEYLGIKVLSPDDIALSMLLVMMHRYDIRRGKAGPTLFDGDEEQESDPSVVVAANDSVFEAAVFQLFQTFDRPYFFGIDNVCDASRKNAELFLQLSAELVETVATQVARSKSPTLSPTLQHKLLRDAAPRSSRHGVFRTMTRFAEWCRP